MSTDIEEPNWLDDDEDLSGEELAYYERALRENRGRIVTRIRNARAALHDTDDSKGDAVDMATDMFEYNQTVQRISNDERTLREIDHALAKFTAGEYGICEGTEEIIRRKRLKLQPWTRYSLEYQEELELERRR